MTAKAQQRDRRHARVRAKVKGSAGRPRLAVWRSNTAVYAQLIDDDKGITLAAADSRQSKAKAPKERAREVGALIAAQATEKKIEGAVFDRGGFRYAGAIKEVAEGAREGGLTL